MTPLGRSLAAIDPEVPEAFVTVDAAVSALEVAPDLIEHSMAIGVERLAPWRATYYFDQSATPRGATVGALTARLAEALGRPVPAPLTEALDDDCVLQHVLGVDAEPPVRLKRYVVFRRPDRAYVERVLTQLGVDAPALEAGRVYILGFDVGPDGLRDVKLYFKLERGKVARYLRGRPELAPVLAGSREVVFAHRLIGARARTMYFHADGPDVLRRDLERRSADHAPSREALDHLRALETSHPMAPWIAGIPYTETGLSERALTLYLHPMQ